MKSPGHRRENRHKDEKMLTNENGFSSNCISSFLPEIPVSKIPLELPRCVKQGMVRLKIFSKKTSQERSVTSFKGKQYLIRFESDMSLSSW